MVLILRIYSCNKLLVTNQGALENILKKKESDFSDFREFVVTLLAVP